jgi:hypothetical protein
MRFSVRGTGILLLVVIAFLAVPALAQQPDDPNDPNKKDDGTVNAKFAAMTREAGAICGVFLPNAIPGITELMPLCGGRAGFKIGHNTMLEPQMLAGSSKGQQYLLGSLSFRGDMQMDDLIGSFYGGGDIHYATAPVYTGTTATSSETNIYFGVHVGGAIWWELTDNLFLRTDLQMNLNPGTSLFVGFSLELRFASGSGGGEIGAAPNP